MVLGPQHTFAYEVVVPAAAEAGQPWPAHPLDGHQRASRWQYLAWDVQSFLTGVTVGDFDRLAGFSPTLEIADGGRTPKPGWDEGRWRPGVLRSCLTFRASSKRGATASEVSFHVDARLTSGLQQGDVLSVVGTGSGGLGLS